MVVAGAVTMTQPLLDELVVLAVVEPQAALAVLAIHLLPRQAKVITEALEVLLQTTVVAAVAVLAKQVLLEVLTEVETAEMVLLLH